MTQIQLDAELRLNRMVEGRDIVTGSLDPLLLAVVDFEVAIDEYAAASYRSEVGRAFSTGQLSAANEKRSVILTAVAVAWEMADADVSGEGPGFRGLLAGIGPSAFAAAADAERKAFRGVDVRWATFRGAREYAAARLV